MRHSFPTAALLSLLLAACASAPGTLPRAVDQSGSLKVHPGLLGQPVPPELQHQDAPAMPAASAGTEGLADKVGDLKVDQAGLQIQRSVYFDLNSAELKAEFHSVLQVHAGHLAKNPQARIRIEGNADERGPADYNRKLGLKRAESARKFLLSQGVNDKQVKATSLGASNPKRRGHDEESWAENRRADLVYERE
jgi:peptidoglycan-associated lipoprotein